MHPFGYRAERRRTKDEPRLRNAAPAASRIGIDDGIVDYTQRAEFEGKVAFTAAYYADLAPGRKRVLQRRRQLPARSNMHYLEKRQCGKP